MGKYKYTKRGIEDWIKDRKDFGGWSERNASKTALRIIGQLQVELDEANKRIEGLGNALVKAERKVDARGRALDGLYAIKGAPQSLIASALNYTGEDEQALKLAKKNGECPQDIEAEQMCQESSEAEKGVE